MVLSSYASSRIEGPSIVPGSERHEYQLYLDMEDIDHTNTNAHQPQTNGICERFHKTILEEF